MFFKIYNKKNFTMGSHGTGWPTHGSRFTSWQYIFFFLAYYQTVMLNSEKKMKWIEFFVLMTAGCHFSNSYIYFFFIFESFLLFYFFLVYSGPFIVDQIVDLLSIVRYPVDWHYSTQDFSTRTFQFVKLDFFFFKFKQKRFIFFDPALDSLSRAMDFLKVYLSTADSANINIKKNQKNKSHTRLIITCSI